MRHVHLGHGPGLYHPAGREREFVVCESCGAVRAVAPAELDAVRAAVLDARRLPRPLHALPARRAVSRVRDEGRRVIGRVRAR